jgi:hypothetical protein
MLACGGATTVWLSARPSRLAAAEPPETVSLDALKPGRWVALPQTTPSPDGGGDLRWSYDRRAGVMVMFGGDNVCGQTYCRTTWLYDVARNRWQLAIPDDAPKGFPTGRCQPGLVYDRARDRTWMHGGLTGRNVRVQREEGYEVGQLWEYSLADNRWVNHEWPGLEDKDGPPNFRRMFFDDASGRLFLIGPAKNQEMVGGWSYTPGENTWKKLPVSGDLPRAWRWDGGYLPMAADTRRQRFVLLEVALKGGPTTIRTLVFDLASSRFREVGGPQPPSRYYHDLVYDEHADRVVLFGGRTADRSLSDTWLFDPEHETWSELRVDAAPTPRQHFAMAYDARNNVTVIYGGSTTEAQLEPKPYRVWVLRVKA